MYFFFKLPEVKLILTDQVLFCYNYIILVFCYEKHKLKNFNE